MRNLLHQARWHRSFASIVCTLVCVMSLATAIAKDATPVAADPVLEAKMMRIAAELRCLVCQNQTLADSDASLAIDLREQMRVMLRAGSDESQVREFMTDRYGDFVLYRPPVKATTLALWFGPGVLLVGGLAGLALVLWRRSRLSEDQFEPDALDVEERFDAQVSAAHALSDAELAAKSRLREKRIRKKQSQKQSQKQAQRAQQRREQESLKRTRGVSP
jgi:cytochrome c-type biogenesis protein CcmH